MPADTACSQTVGSQGVAEDQQSQIQYFLVGGRNAGLGNGTWQLDIPGCVVKCYVQPHDAPVASNKGGDKASNISTQGM